MFSSHLTIIFRQSIHPRSLKKQPTASGCRFSPQNHEHWPTYLKNTVPGGRPNLSKKRTESTMQLNLMTSKLPEAIGKFQKLPSKSCIKSCSNLGALLQSCGKPCSTLTTSLEANIAAFLQQLCNNLAAIILKQCRGRAGGQSCSKLAASLESSTLAVLLQQFCSKPCSKPCSNHAAILQQLSWSVGAGGRAGNLAANLESSILAALLQQFCTKLNHKTKTQK